MGEVMRFVSGNGLWVMIVAVVAIGGWFKFREKELQAHQEFRKRELEHQQKMKQLEIDLENAKARSSGSPVAKEP
jgi:predicted negative regulator of RcsB-dependent stress response